MKINISVLIALFFWLCFICVLDAQVGIGTNNPDASSGLDVNFTDKGFLAPRMTNEQREAIDNPAEGLIIFNITTGCVNYFHSNAWYEWCGNLVPFICGTSKVRFSYNGSPVAYGTVTGANGKCWLDRNLGASQVANSSADDAAFGDLFQWGRLDDGHQVRTASTTTVLSNSDVPGHDDFILSNNYPSDWRSPQNVNLWQGVNGVNNPCPTGFRLPTQAEWDTERLSWNSNNAAGAFASPLKLPVSGYRSNSNGLFYYEGMYGFYWTSSVINTIYSRFLAFNNTSAYLENDIRAIAFSIRCIQDTDPVGSIGSLNCAGATITGTLLDGVAASGVSASVPYTGGNGGSHTGQTVSSTGVTGLTAYLYPGVFANGTGNLNYSITGTPVGSGTASFALNIGGQTCSIDIPVAIPSACGTNVTFTYGGNSVTYGTVLSANSKCWLDRNLGATQVATSSTDASAYGDLFQWGRLADGHQQRASGTTTTLSSSDVPGHGNFILSLSSPNDWRSPQNNDLWQGVNGINNPCPVGYRPPTLSEWDTERASWNTNNAAGAFASPLKLSVGGYRQFMNGIVYQAGTDGWGYYWSSTTNSGINSMCLIFGNVNAQMAEDKRAAGMSVRCIKD